MEYLIKAGFSLTIYLLVLIFSGPIPSSAQVHYTDIIPDQEIEVSIPYPTDCNGEQYPLDINGDGDVDFTVNARCNLGYPDTTIISIESVSSLDFFVADAFVDTLNLNDIIDPSLPWVTGEMLLYGQEVYHGNSFGNWTIDNEHYVGLKIIKGSLTYFGWLRMMITDPPVGCGYIKGAVMKDFACNPQPGEPLFAGEGLLNFALNIQVTDVGDQKNGADMKVSFDPAYIEAGLVRYRIMVVNATQAGTFTLDSANAVTADHYSSITADGTSHSLQLASTATSTDGQLITNRIGYSVFILSCYENTSENVLSYPVPFLLQTQTQAVTSVLGTDSGNAGNGSDVQVSFNKIPNEDGISEYRIMVVPGEQGEIFNLDMADLVGQANYTAIEPSGTDISALLDPEATDINGDTIMEEKSYYIYVLSVADGILTDKNALSAPSNVLILSVPDYLYAGQRDMSCIHYVDIEPDTVVWASYGEPSNTRYRLDLNGDGTNDYLFTCYDGGSIGYWESGSGLEGLNQNNKIITTGSSLWIKKFNHGDPLTFMDGERSEDCLLSRFAQGEMSGPSISGYWNGAKNKYAGLIMFHGNDTIMAWVKMTVGGYCYVTIKEYAWMVYSHQTVADFTYEKDEYEVHFAQTSKMADSLIWNFGDGSFSTEANPVHVFSQEGDFLVTLIASGPFGTDTAAQLINICEMPTASFWFDLSRWGDLTLYNESLKADTYYWNFGDGNVSNEETPEYTYMENGTYKLSLITARGSCRDTLKANVIVCIYPKVDFYFEELDSTVHFHSTSLTADSIYWDFGDGFGSFLTDPVHTFNQSQQFQITLHGWNACGHDSITKMVLSMEEFLSVPFIYPNPVRDQLYIKPPFPVKKTTAHLYDPSGQPISLQYSLTHGNETTILDLSGIKEGIYLLEILLDDRIVREKIIVIR